MLNQIKFKCMENDNKKLLIYLISYVLINIICVAGYTLINIGFILIGFLVEFVSLALIILLAYYVLKDIDN